MEEIVTKKKKKEWQEIVLENENISLSLLPELGGKMTKIVNKRTGTQFLKQLENEEGELKEPSMGFEFKPPYAFGFDECFPTVAPSKYPFNERVIQWPDHGELWTQHWEHEQDGNSIILKATGVNLLYEFQKEITLKRNEIEISYSLKNNLQYSFDYIWSAHPLLEIDEDDELLLPEKIDEVSVYYAAKEKETKVKANWPFMNGDETDLSMVQPQSKDLAMKLFVENMKTGKAGLYRKKYDETILFNFDIKKITHLGLWLCYGGWPEDAEIGSYTVALEPTTASFDKLSEAIDNDQNRSIKPDEVITWDLSLKILNGKAEI